MPQYAWVCNVLETSWKVNLIFNQTIVILDWLSNQLVGLRWNNHSSLLRINFFSVEMKHSSSSTSSSFDGVTPQASIPKIIAVTNINITCNVNCIRIAKESESFIFPFEHFVVTIVRYLDGSIGHVWTPRVLNITSLCSCRYTVVLSCRPDFGFRAEVPKDFQNFSLKAAHHMLRKAT